MLLLDEPMGGMNQEEKEDMARFILDVNQERGVTVLLIEHDMGVVMDISEQVRGARPRPQDCRRHAGRGAEQIPPSSQAYLGTSQGSPAAVVAAVIAWSANYYSSIHGFVQS